MYVCGQFVLFLLALSNTNDYVSLFTEIRILDFTVGHFGNTTVDNLHHVNYVLLLTYNFKLCVSLYNLYIKAKK